MVDRAKWERTVIGKVAELATGTTPPSEKTEYFGGEIYWYTPVDLRSQGFLSASSRRLTKLAVEDRKARIFPPNTVLLTTIGASLGNLGLLSEAASANQQITGVSVFTNEISPEFLFYYLLSRHEELIQWSSKATLPILNQKKLKEFPVEYPHLTEQQRIVTLLRECFERIGEIKRLYQENFYEVWSLKRSLVIGENRFDRTWLELSELVDWIRETETVIETETYQFAGAKSFGKGLFRSATRTGQEFKYKDVRRLQHRDFTYPKLMAWEGAFGMVPKELDGFVVSPEFVVFRTKGDICPEVLDTYFRSPLCLDDVRNASTGSNKRRRRLNPQAFLKLKVPVPPHEAQEQLKKVYEFEAKAAESWKDLPETLEKIRQGILKKAFAGEL